MAVATPNDVAIALGRPAFSGDEEAQVDYWLNGAEIQIQARLGDLADLDQAVLAYVVTEAVAAKMLNPNGYQYEAIDDYRYGLPAESRRVTILDEWWNLLSPNTGSGAFSVRPSFEADAPPSHIWDWEIG